MAPEGTQPDLARPRQRNCQVEPRYPAHSTIIWSFRYPEMVCHDASVRCPIREPHLVPECGEFDMETFRMDCNSCGGVFRIVVEREPDDYPQQTDPEALFYCPVCSSAEETTKVED